MLFKSILGSRAVTAFWSFRLNQPIPYSIINRIVSDGTMHSELDTSTSTMHCGRLCHGVCSSRREIGLSYYQSLTIEYPKSFFASRTMRPSLTSLSGKTAAQKHSTLNRLISKSRFGWCMGATWDYASTRRSRRFVAVLVARHEFWVSASLFFLFHIS